VTRVSRARAARLIAVAAASLAILAAFAPSALAADGVGLWGPTNDKVVTYFGFGTLLFFTVLVTVLSLVQGRLETRKERRRQELERLRPPAAD
jgi:hypothetical protein